MKQECRDAISSGANSASHHLTGEAGAGLRCVYRAPPAGGIGEKEWDQRIPIMYSLSAVHAELSKQARAYSNHA